jgi:hypothetical protein
MYQMKNRVEAFIFAMIAGATIVVVMAAFGIVIGALTK